MLQGNVFLSRSELILVCADSEGVRWHKQEQLVPIRLLWLSLASRQCSLPIQQVPDRTTAASSHWARHRDDKAYWLHIFSLQQKSVAQLFAEPLSHFQIGVHLQHSIGDCKLQYSIGFLTQPLAVKRQILCGATCKVILMTTAAASHKILLAASSSSEVDE